MPKFIYVFDKEGRDRLLDMRFELLHSDETNHRYVFLNREDQTFSSNAFPYVQSDTLTF